MILSMPERINECLANEDGADDAKTASMQPEPTLIRSFIGETDVVLPNHDPAYEGILRGPSASEHRRTYVPAPARVSASSYMGFSDRRGTLRPLFRTSHDLLGYQRSPTCFDLSVYHLSVDLIGRPARLPGLPFPASSVSLL
jgi:hypothetical protein